MNEKIAEAILKLLEGMPKDAQHDVIDQVLVSLGLRGDAFEDDEVQP